MEEPVPDLKTPQYPFDCPGYYQIRLQGALGKCWIDHLGGLEISTGPWVNYPQVTQINGWLADQAALAGLLELLNDLGMVILTVERLGSDEKND
jgi:hypothetical protein